jgi:hypothetical protein
MCKDTLLTGGLIAFWIIMALIMNHRDNKRKRHVIE